MGQLVSQPANDFRSNESLPNWVRCASDEQLAVNPYAAYYLGEDLWIALACEYLKDVGPQTYFAKLVLLQRGEDEFDKGDYESEIGD